MPAFTFTSPEGKNYTVNGPDGATQEQAFQMLQTQMGQGSSTPAKLPGNQVPDSNTAVQSAPQPQPSLLDKVTAAANTGVGMVHNAVAAVPAAVAQGGRYLVDRVSGNGPSDVGATFDAVMNAIGHKAASPLEADYTRNVGDFVNNSGLATLPALSGEMSALSALSKPAVSSVSAAVQPELSIAKNAAGAVAKAVSPDANTAAMARKLQDIGGSVPLHTLSNNKFVRMAGEAMDNLPLSGSTKPGNKLAVNQALLKKIGADAKPDELLTPSNFGPAMDKSGAAIGDIYNSADIPLDATFKGDLDAISGAQKLQTPDVRNIVNSYIDDIKSAAADDGVIPGQALRTHDSALGLRIRQLPPGDLRGQLSDLQETLRDALARQLPENDAADLSVFRKQYAIGKLLEPLVAKSAFQGVSPQALMARETATAAGKNRMAMGAAGDMGDLANIGQMFLKEQPSSGTAERGLLVGAALDAAKAGLGVTAGNIYNRLGPIIASKMVGKAPGVAEAVGKDLTLAPMGEDLPTTTSPFTPKPPEASPLLSVADEPSPTPRAASEQPAVDLPLHQEVFRQRDITQAINDFQTESARLQSIIATKGAKAAQAEVQQLDSLQKDFAAKMNGLRSNFYNDWYTKLPIEHGYSGGGGIGIANPNDAPNPAPTKQLPIEQQGRAGFRVKVLSYNENGRPDELMIVPHDGETVQ